MKNSDLITQFENLPSDTTREFELKVYAIIKTFDKMELYKECESILFNNENLDIKYAAFYTLATLHRRDKNINVLNELINKYGVAFISKLSFSHIKNMFTKDKGATKSEYIDLIKNTHSTAKKMMDHSGVIHMFAETVATGYETIEQIREEIKDEWLDKAIKFIKLAIELEPNYAKFYCTLGRLRAITGNIEDAFKQINNAINFEDSSRSDYFMIISEYQYFLLLTQNNYYKDKFDKDIKETKKVMNEHLKDSLDIINTKIKETSDNIDKQLEENLDIINEKIKETSNKTKLLKDKIEKTFRDANKTNIEILGFFIGALSFIMGSIQIFIKMDTGDALIIVFALFVCLISSYCSFSLIINNNENTIVKSVMLIVGVIILCSLIIVYNFTF